MHGPTYMANPLACAAGLASLWSLLRDGLAWREEVGRKSSVGLAAGLATALAPSRAVNRSALIGRDRGHRAGEGPVDVASATAAAVERGVWLRPFRNLIYTMPPYICTPDEIAQVTSAMVEVARLTGSRRL